MKDPPSGDQRHVPAAIYFHPLSIGELADRNFNIWTSYTLMTQVVGPNALEEAKRRDSAPVDFLHDVWLAGIMLHEVSAD